MGNSRSRLAERIAAFKEELTPIASRYFFGGLSGRELFEAKNKLIESLFNGYDSTFAKITTTCNPKEAEEAKSLFSVLICDNLMHEFKPLGNDSSLGANVFNWLKMKLDYKLHDNSENTYIALLKPGTDVFVSPDESSARRTLEKAMSLTSTGTIGDYAKLSFHTRLGGNEVYSVYARLADITLTDVSTISTTPDNGDDDDDTLPEAASPDNVEDYANVCTLLDDYLGKAAICVVDYLEKLNSNKPVYEKMFFSEDVIRLVREASIDRGWSFRHERDCLRTAEIDYIGFLFGEKRKDQLNYRYISSSPLTTYSAVGASELDKPIRLNKGSTAGSGVYRAFFDQNSIPYSPSFNVTMSRRLTKYNKCMSIFNDDLRKDNAI